MFQKVKKNLKTKYFDWQTSDILKTSPVRCKPSNNVIILSMLCSRDLRMYLLALKTFCRFVEPFKVAIVSDGLTQEEKLTLDAHIENLEIIDVQDVDTFGLPRGGCWERLVSLLDKKSREGKYVIQLDADTLTLSDPVLVRRCIDDGVSFTMGTHMGQAFITFREASELLKNNHTKSNHVQVLAELAMSEFPGCNELRYVRGCAGFAGFSVDSWGLPELSDVSREMERYVGAAKWNEWGSEQVASNIVIANARNPVVLPIKNYGYFKPDIAYNECCFLHFVGSYRFMGGVYSRIATEQIALL